MRLIIVRHGETEDNAAKIIQGASESHLSEHGRRQAEHLCLRLLKEPIDVIYSSDLQRCKDTIAPYLLHHNVPVHYTKMLRERSFGEFEGKPYTALHEWRTKRKVVGFDRGAPPGGESHDEVERRVIDFLQIIFEREKGKNVLVVTHSGIKLPMVLYLLGRGTESYAEYKPGNTAVSIFRIRDDKKHVAECVNCLKHLPK